MGRATEHAPHVALPFNNDMRLSFAVDRASQLKVPARWPRRQPSKARILSTERGIYVARVASAQARPTDASVARFGELRAELDGYLAELQEIFDTDLAAFNARVAEAGQPAVFPSKGRRDPS